MYEVLMGGRILYFPSSVRRLLQDLHLWLIEGLQDLQAGSPQVLPVSVPVPIRRTSMLRIREGA